MKVNLIVLDLMDVIMNGGDLVNIWKSKSAANSNLEVVE